MLKFCCQFCLTFDFGWSIIIRNKGDDGEKDIFTQHVGADFRGAGKPMHRRIEILRLVKAGADGYVNTLPS